MAPRISGPTKVRLMVVGDDAPFHYHTVGGLAFTRQTFSKDYAHLDEAGNPHRVPLDGTVCVLEPLQLERIRRDLRARYAAPLPGQGRMQIQTLPLDDKGNPVGRPAGHWIPVSRFLRVEPVVDGVKVGEGENLLEDPKPATAPSVPPAK